MNGLTGEKMQKIFKALVSESVYDDPRSLLEYCCFRFLSRNNAEVHPRLKVRRNGAQFQSWVIFHLQKSNYLFHSADRPSHRRKCMCGGLVNIMFIFEIYVS